MDNLVPGVYNYCTRWCERCPFKGRCRTHRLAMKFDAEPMYETPSAFPAMSQPFSSYWPRLKRVLEGLSLDWEVCTLGLDKQAPAATACLSDKEVREMSKSISAYLLDRENSDMSWIRVKEVFDTPLGQGISCLRAYGLTLGSKFACIVGSTERERPQLGIKGTQTTAKLLHIVSARLLAAATIIMEEKPEVIKPLLPIVLDTCRLLHYLRINHPKAYLGQRTTFDNPKYAKEIKDFYKGHLPIDPFRDNSWSKGVRAPAE